MIHSISRTIKRLSSLVKSIQIKSFLTTCLMGLIILTSTANYQGSDRSVSNRLYQGNDERPTTTREWYEKARQTEGEPLERTKEIAKESAQALKEFTEVYPDTAERTAPDILKDN